VIFLEWSDMVEQKSRKRGERGVMMIMLTLAIPLFVGLVGLAIDATICFIAQAELSAAVDGAALGTGRLLTTNANPTNIAGEFLIANFPAPTTTSLCSGCSPAPRTWNSFNLTPTVNVVTGITKTVTINATAQVPLLFMRIFGQQSATISAFAQATRKDARIEFVIDRSGSMTNVDKTTGEEAITELIGSAVGFTQGFTEGEDEMGLVVFDGSAVVGYPTTPWPTPLTYNGGGGPDTNFQSGATTDMVHQLQAVQAGGATAMGEALAIAYNEIQKAHMRDLQANGADTRINAIVLFTDGVPSSVAIYPNKVGSSVIINPGSGCKNPTDTNPPTTSIIGAIWVSGDTIPYSGNAYTGFYLLGTLDPNYATHTSQWYMQHASSESNQTGGAESGCNTFPASSLSAIPSADKYGYAITPNMETGTAGYLYSISESTNTHIYSSESWNPSKVNENYQWGLASWNDVDNIGSAIRQDSNWVNRAGDGKQIVIQLFTIGYSGDGGTDDGLLQKIANVSGCKVNGLDCFMNNQSVGNYYPASNGAELASAMDNIQSAILRLAH
jgi:Flp pilus assembly protein TadG